MEERGGREVTEGDGGKGKEGERCRRDRERGR